MESNSNDEITLKELILLAQEYGREIWSKKWLILILSIPFLTYTTYSSFTKPMLFKGEIKFIIEGESSGGALGGLLGKIGMGQKMKSVNPWQIIEVAKSNNTMEKLLFQKYKNRLIIERLINEYDLISLWGEEDPHFSKFKFINNKLDEFEGLESKAFKKVSKLMFDGLGKSNISPLVVITFNEEDNIFTIKSETINEELSQLLVESLYNQLKDFYEVRVIQEKKKNLEFLKSKVDSLDYLLKQKVYLLGRFDDRTEGLMKKEKKAERRILYGEIEMLTKAFGDSNAAYEMAHYDLASIKPTFVMINKSYFPLSVIKSQLWKNMALTFILMVLISALIIVGLKLYKNIMN